MKTFLRLSLVAITLVLVAPAVQAADLAPAASPPEATVESVSLDEVLAGEQAGCQDGVATQASLDTVVPDAVSAASFACIDSGISCGSVGSCREVCLGCTCSSFTYTCVYCP